ncbi:hypothetical protein PAB09_07635 [Corynebacterium sp. SCR221107]|uniref:hypothetical protein n=1 Tax=Corynebacterium sp. SCR221107 TaxID=3017361 RepID=UPI0022EC75B5|nr:hypothetical protein [Corynebacterium sp. SCR221107]WBT07801.1 hypothetical protein PAB09_07635 [Corynebacterium sp. SCR221107]
MKMFSRKSLVAVATAVAVATGSMAAPAMAEDTASAITTHDDTDQNDTDQNSGSEDPAKSNSIVSKIFSGSSDENGKLDTEQITAWIGVITTVVTTLSALITLVTKFQNLAK